MMPAGRMLIKGGLVANPSTGEVSALDLLIENGVIAAAAAPEVHNEPGIAAHDARNCLILPGLVNAHTHSHANLMKGVADRWTLEASLTNAPWLGGERDPETVYLSTLIGAADMLSKGCTACFDLFYEFPRPSASGLAAAAQAYADAGMRAVIAPMIADKTLFSAIPGLFESLPDSIRADLQHLTLANGDQTIAAIEDIAAAKNSLPANVRLAIAPTIPHHCSEDFLLKCVAIAEEHNFPIHMHIAESRLQALTALKLYGRSPVKYLASRGVLRPGFVAAHSIWLDDSDLDLLAENRCAVAHIPASNFRLGSGIAHVRPMLDRGITVGLATDGANSADALSMLEAMRLASYASRAYDSSRDRWLSAAETVRLATEGGAGVLGLPFGGGLQKGAPADFTFFDLTCIDFIPLRDPLNQAVTCADSRSVRHVMIGGRLVVRDGKIISIDAAALGERASAAIARLSTVTAKAKRLAESLEGYVVAFAEKASCEPLGIERLVRGEAGT
jgi:5-methylthioadenosine/S-adenosylhomocysteine deaminase